MVPFERGHCRLRIEVATELVGEPMGQCAAGREPRHAPMLTREQPGRLPEPFVFHAPLGDEDREDRRAVHQHHVAGLKRADADRLRGSVDCADDDRRTGRKACLLSGARSDAAGYIGGPGQLRQPIQFPDLGASALLHVCSSIR
jgi:hypothetical protein